MLWYWVGSRLDLRWRVTDQAPWIALCVFSVVSLAGAFLRISYADFLPYGFVLWVIAALTLSRFTRVCSGIPVPNRNRKVPRD